MNAEIKILDACCGSRMFWFDKERKDVLFMDNRNFDETVHGHRIKVEPGLFADFRDMPFKKGVFSHIVFGPPHLLSAGEGSWLRAKYGVLDKETWRDDLKKWFSECWRVLATNGTLVFKWSEVQIPLKEIWPLFPAEPLYGTRTGKSGKTVWLTFFKGSREDI